MASTHEYSNRGAERSVAVSPLLNLAPENGRGAAMRQHVRLVPLGGSGIEGAALLSLSADRRTLEVALRLERPRPVTIGLRLAAEDVLILHVSAGGASGHALCRGRRFPLDPAAGFPALLRPEELAAAGLFLASGRADAIEGIAVAAARRTRPSYLAERMLSEIAAAEGSASAVAASRHVELATLYARQLRPSA
jgi:hypothetical protein